MAGAKVHLAKWPDGTEMGTLTTESDGTFKRPEQSQFIYFVVPEDLYIQRFALTAEDAGGKSSPVVVVGGVRYLFLGGPSRSAENLGDFCLHKRVGGRESRGWRERSCRAQARIWRVMSWMCWCAGAQEPVSRRAGDVAAGD